MKISPPISRMGRCDIPLRELRPGTFVPRLVQSRLFAPSARHMRSRLAGLVLLEPVRPFGSVAALLVALTRLAVNVDYNRWNKWFFAALGFA
jgi:hypothetical protein